MTEQEKWVKEIDKARKKHLTIQIGNLRMKFYYFNGDELPAGEKVVCTSIRSGYNVDLYCNANTLGSSSKELLKDFMSWI